MEFYTFEIHGNLPSKPRRAAVVMAESWEKGLEELKRFGHDKGMRATHDDYRASFNDEWAPAIEATRPWLGSVQIDSLIVIGPSWALRPNDADEWTQGNDVTMILVASEGAKRRVLH